MTVVTNLNKCVAVNFTMINNQTIKQSSSVKDYKYFISQLNKTHHNLI